MKRHQYWIKRVMDFIMVCLVTLTVSLMTVLLILLITSCERRDLYVYGDEFHSLTLHVDWHDYADRNPDGMTAWFWPRETDDREVPDSLASWGEPYRFTTANVQKYDLYLHSGKYHGVVIDYSPEEYSRQQFLDMDDIWQARVVATPDPNQPQEDSLGLNKALYGSEAYGHGMPETQGGNGLYVVRSQPEEMGVDTLCNMEVTAGEYGDYVPYSERNTYQQQLTVKEFRVKPQSPIWQLRLRLPVKGVTNIWQVVATVAGLADGYYLARGCNTNSPCMVRVTDWQVVKTDNEGHGYVDTTVRTFGLRPKACTTSSARTTRGGELVITDASEVRLNLQFTLRDRKTVCTYQYDLGRYVEEFGDEQVLRLWLDEDDFKEDPNLGSGDIDLPYVDAYEGTGFGADVTPWEDGQEAEVSM